MEKNLIILMLCNITFLSYGAQSYAPKLVAHPLAAVDMRQHRREQQEDRVSRRVVAGGTWYAVFDGHGGPEVADFLKYNLHKYFEEAQADTIKGKMEAAFKRADECEFVRKHENVGSTASVVFIKDGTAHFAHVGDSLIFLKKGSGISFVTEPHRTTNAVEVARIDTLNGVEKRGDSVDQGRFIVRGCRGGIGVSRSIGDYKYNKEKQVIIFEPEYSEIALTSENKFLVLMTDGVSDFVTPDAIASTLPEEIDKNLDALVQELGNTVQAANAQDKKADNATIMVVDLQTPYEKKWSAKTKILIFGGGFSLAALFAFLCWKSIR